MIGARTVVRQHLRRSTADEERAVIPKSRRDGSRVLQAELQVLGRERITCRDAFLHIRDHHDTAIRQCRASDFCAGQVA